MELADPADEPVAGADDGRPAGVERIAVGRGLVRDRGHAQLVGEQLHEALGVVQVVRPGAARFQDAGSAAPVRANPSRHHSVGPDASRP